MRHPYFPKGVLEDMADGFNNRWRTMRRAFRNYGSENDWIHLRGNEGAFDGYYELMRPRGGRDTQTNQSSRRTVRITFRFLNIMHEALTRFRRRVLKRARDAFTVRFRDDTPYRGGTIQNLGFGHASGNSNTRRLRTYRIGRTAVPSNWNTAAPRWIRDTYEVGSFYED